MLEIDDCIYLLTSILKEKQHELLEHILDPFPLAETLFLNDFGNDLSALPIRNRYHV